MMETFGTIALGISLMGTVAGWVVTAARAAARLQLRMQRLEDELKHIAAQLGEQNAKIAALTEQVMEQNGRVRELEVSFARHEGGSK